MSADPQEEDVLMFEFDSVLNTPPLRPALDEMVAMDVEADLAEIHQPLPPTPITPEIIEQLFNTSALLKACGVVFKQTENYTYQLTYQGQNYAVIFKPEVFDQMPSTQLMTFGDPLFEILVQIASGVV